MRTKPSPGYRNSHTFDDIRRQLGQTPSGNFVYGNTEARGLLKLQPRLWHEHSGDLFDTTELPTFGFASGMGTYANSWISRDCRLGLNLDDYYEDRANYTAPLDIFKILFNDDLDGPQKLVYVDPTYSARAQEIIDSGGDIAHMLQLLLTVVASSA